MNDRRLCTVDGKVPALPDSLTCKPHTDRYPGMREAVYRQGRADAAKAIRDYADVHARPGDMARFRLRQHLMLAAGLADPGSGEGGNVVQLHTEGMS